jgi:hypothetical protein
MENKMRRRRQDLFFGSLRLLLFAAMLSGCAEFVRPVQPGEPVVEKTGTGLIVGRIAINRDGEDRMTSLPGFPRSFGWELIQAETGKKFVVDPLTENGFFALPLPAGIYHLTKLRYEDRYGLWEGILAASFSVKPGSPTYLGTWEITFAGLGPGVPITGRTLNTLQQDRNEFEDRYAIKPGAVTVALLQSASEGHFSLVRPRSEQ